MEDLGVSAYAIPEAMEGLLYYNPLFITREEEVELSEAGSIVKLQEVYSGVAGLARAKAAYELKLGPFSAYISAPKNST